MTPCGVLYRAICVAAGNKRYDEIDARILSRAPIDSHGASPYERVLRSGTYRTREIIQKRPENLDARFFVDGYTASVRIASYLKSCGRKNREIVGYFSTEAKMAMIESVCQCGYDPLVFRNAIDDVVRNNNADDSHCAVAVFALFYLTGVYGNPQVSVSAFFDMLRAHAIPVDLSTSMFPDATVDLAGSSPQYALLGLVRSFDDDTVGKTLYALNPDGEGTVIGRIETSESSINDVDKTVSRRHLRVFRYGETWYAEGLGSTNGSTVIRPDGTIEVIEKPRKIRAAGELSNQVSICQGDLLRLGFKTQFKVVLMGHSFEDVSK